jgi:hypothetical protein
MRDMVAASGLPFVAALDFAPDLDFDLAIPARFWCRRSLAGRPVARKSRGLKSLEI